MQRLGGRKEFGLLDKLKRSLCSESLCKGSIVRDELGKAGRSHCVSFSPSETQHS